LSVSNWTFGWNASALAAVVRMAQALRDFGLIAVYALRALAVAMVQRPMVRVRLAKNKVFNSVVGADAVDVMNDFVLGQRATNVGLHDRSVLKHDALFDRTNDVAVRADGALPALPRRAALAMERLHGLERATLRTLRLRGSDLRFKALEGRSALGACVSSPHAETITCLS
jgi:hypothetical protein